MKLEIGQIVYVRGFSSRNGPTATKELGTIVNIKGTMCDVKMPDGRTYAISIRRISAKKEKT